MYHISSFLIACKPDPNETNGTSLSFRFLTMSSVNLMLLNFDCQIFYRKSAISFYNMQARSNLKFVFVLNLLKNIFSI
jgi:hypothetical protein